MPDTDTPAEAVNSSVAIVDGPAPVVEGPAWKKAAVITKGGALPAGRKTVVVESVTHPAKYDEAGDLQEPARFKTTGYPTGADLYYRTAGSGVEFPADAKVFTLGENVRATGIGGFSPRSGLRTGPGHPAYAGANLAYQKGARDIQILGLNKAEQDALEPWFQSKWPDDVKVTFG